ncbi:2-keto-4-pentenoate hydratase [Phenylobacterium sp.]|uniref:2-keto-4-pentenoate hydratase n=1 Tax=Phenylobacterium sp. TaxID=1871053 RepID=UPI002736C602|nr:fumarylacetoacetate hydrolase family protein [Phenylobacterium sp.]MDP3659239.1 fumarylacetoacetate hydrolase family protein [Phenylobacterium sp.]
MSTMDPRTVTLLAAERERREIDRIDPQGLVGEDEAYRLQFEGIADKLARGEQIVGLKTGLTSKAKQQTMGVLQPILGHLLGSGLVANGGVVDTKPLIHPRAEPEIAFRLGRDLNGPTTIAQARAAAATVMPALEIIDSRFKDFKFGLGDVIADNTSAARVVLGPETPVSSDYELKLVGMVYSKNGEVMATASGAAILGDPWEALAWLATRASELGRPLKAGQVALAGALTDAVFVHPGDAVRLEFDRLGVLDASFS